MHTLEIQTKAVFSLTVDTGCEKTVGKFGDFRELLSLMILNIPLSPHEK